MIGFVTLCLNILNCFCRKQILVAYPIHSLLPVDFHSLERDTGQCGSHQPHLLGSSPAQQSLAQGWNVPSAGRLGCLLGSFLEIQGQRLTLFQDLAKADTTLGNVGILKSGKEPVLRSLLALMTSFWISTTFLTLDTEVNEGLGDDLCMFQKFSQNVSRSSFEGFEDIITNCPQHWDLNSETRRKMAIQCPIICLKTKGIH